LVWQKLWQFNSNSDVKMVVKLSKTFSICVVLRTDRVKNGEEEAKDLLQEVSFSH